MKLAPTIAIIIAMSLQGAATQQVQPEVVSEGVVRAGFITGQQFRQLAEAQRLHYAIGLLDGALIAPLFGATRESMTWLETCTKPMTAGQVVAIVSKFVDDNPSQWHVPMNLLFYNAMRQSCRQQQ